ncbi:MAG: DNA repair protein RadA [Candidatus Thermoplasmatota archaeon]|jgi:hypothetical protein|nr:DNA repair protein RadA [Candidatus Thermoplasmatota archaeon]MCL5785056.1 DNA repair protein RadA [Candidatus Thermoplasmatota archaeon]
MFDRARSSAREFSAIRIVSPGSRESKDASHSYSYGKLMNGEYQCQVCGALSPDPGKCSNCGSPIGGVEHVHPASGSRKSYRHREQEAVNNARAKSVRHLSQDERVLESFTSDFAFIHRSKRLDSMVGVLSLSIYVVPLVLGFGNYTSGNSIMFSTLIAMIPVFCPLAVYIFHYAVYGFDPRKTVYVMTNRRFMVCNSRGRYVSSIWFRGTETLVVVSNGDGNNGLSILFPIPIVLEKKDISQGRFFGHYSRRIRKIMKSGSGWEFWKRAISFVSSSQVESLIKLVNSNSAAPIKTLEYSLDRRKPSANSPYLP